MRNFVIILLTSMLLIVLPTAVNASENPNDHAEEKAEEGLVRGVLHQVKNTVNETVKSTGELVEETATFATDTVERTVDFTEETVKTVIDPQKEKPVKAVVENTTDFIGKTVDNTVPVVEQTTKTVQTVTDEATKVTKPLPKVPVVTPVLDKATETIGGVTEQVKQTVDETVSTGAETVAKPLKKEPVKEKPPVIEDFPSQEQSEQQIDQSSHPSVPGETDEEKFPESGIPPTAIPEVNTPLEGKHPRPFQPKPDGNDMDEKLVENNMSEAAMVEVEDSVDERQVTHFSAQGIEPIEDQSTLERSRVKEKKEPEASSATSSSDDFVPLKQANDHSWMSAIQLTTSSSSISISTTSTSSGISGLGAVLTDDWRMKAETIRQKWYLEDIIGVLQWSHAPPGQPPQSTPFL